VAALRGFGIIIATVDGGVEKSLVSQEKIKGFPLLRLYRRDVPDEPVTYMGERNVGSIMDFLYEELRPDSAPLPTVAALAAHIAADRRALVIGILSSSSSGAAPVEGAGGGEGASFGKIFSRVAHQLRGAVRFATLPEAEAATHPQLRTIRTMGGSSSGDGVAILAENGTRFEGSRSREVLGGPVSLAGWVRVHALAPFGEITAANYHAYRESAMPLGIMLLPTR